MSLTIKSTTTLNNGVQMPWLGLGVWKVTAEGEARRAIHAALEAGYRSIDTARIYKNEEDVGDAIRTSGVPRDEIFVTTKIWNEDQGYDRTLVAFEESRKRLGLDVIDLLLIHWPGTDKFQDTWRAFEKLYKDGFVRAIGVSNFKVHHLKKLAETSSIVPAVNQVEYHPLLTQKELLAYAKQNGIQLEAWSPLMQGNLDQPVLQELAAKYGKTVAQIILRWDIQSGVVTIPKSVTPSRIAENGNLFDFSLSDEDMAKIDGLNQDHRFGSDPDKLLF
ncbi:aldo/keto reductase [Cohnella thailandensis]|uniref:Aldo/keto reductase n=1 Tax=Cohnella thailandensis TaxID=557557 RepID=A0A841SZN4_9BACL|nr:aldo/keto reductase [Cohnella thailandensis]MBB6635608.1 aldo/keto reductase [Cohnella thailandensis]MBP1974988.1 diketogulonate reductase-like aldo/keto reductase [Cohnella thailandensis]